MAANMGCYADHCSGQVIGQCPGYGAPCGRFYCREHSNGNLCTECARLQVEAEHHQWVEAETARLMRLYETLSAGVHQQSARDIRGANWATTAIVLGPTIASAVLWVLIMNLGNLKLSMWIGLFGFVWFMGSISVTAKRLQKLRFDAGVRLTRRIEQKYAGFCDYYAEWRKNKSREYRAKVVRGVVIGAALLGAAAVGAAAGGSREDQMARDVRDIKNRLDRL